MVNMHVPPACDSFHTRTVLSHEALNTVFGSSPFTILQTEKKIILSVNIPVHTISLRAGWLYLFRPQKKLLFLL